MRSRSRLWTTLAALLAGVLLNSIVKATDTPPLAQPAMDTQALIQPFTEFRMAFASRPGYISSWVAEPEREAANKALQSKQGADFLRLSRAWLLKCPVDARIHLVRASELSEGGDLAGAAFHRMMFYGLLMSIISSGDGFSKDSAYKVISVDEEYTVMNYLGAKLKKQRLDGHYDVMNVELNGKNNIMYFDITVPLKAMATELDGSKEKP